LHELPAGVLSGPDAATLSECDELLADVEEFKRLAAVEGLISRFEQKLVMWTYYFKGYKEYKVNRKQYASFADYLERNPIPTIPL